MQSCQRSVSVADKAVEELIISKISETFPTHDIFGEETGHAGKNSEYCWIVDPIDGTQSFVKHHPYFGISIALYKNGKGYAGAVYAPALGRLFTAESGKCIFEMSPHQTQRVAAALEAENFQTEIICDQFGKERFVYGCRR